MYRHPSKRFIAKLHEDGSVEFIDDPEVVRILGYDPDEKNFALPKTLYTPEGKVIQGPAQLEVQHNPGTRAAMRLGEDLYARDKLALLKATEQLRMDMAEAHRVESIERARYALNAELTELWSAAEHDAAHRRELIFQRWDECDADAPGPHSSAVERARQAACSGASQQIYAFIRKHAPFGSADGYTISELRDMNERRARGAPFAPYAAD